MVSNLIVSKTYRVTTFLFQILITFVMDTKIKYITYKTQI